MNYDAVIGGAVGAFVGVIAARLVDAAISLIVYLRSWCVAFAKEAGKRRKSC
ncbi:MAG: hypothetical protein VW239_04785 [Candidatus Nanopelagicales bacterium]